MFIDKLSKYFLVFLTFFLISSSLYADAQINNSIKSDLSHAGLTAYIEFNTFGIQPNGRSLLMLNGKDKLAAVASSEDVMRKMTETLRTIAAKHSKVPASSIDVKYTFSGHITVSYTGRDLKRSGSTKKEIIKGTVIKDEKSIASILDTLKKIISDFRHGKAPSDSLLPKSKVTTKRIVEIVKDYYSNEIKKLPVYKKGSSATVTCKEEDRTETSLKCTANLKNIIVAKGSSEIIIHIQIDPSNFSNTTIGLISTGKYSSRRRGDTITYPEHQSLEEVKYKDKYDAHLNSLFDYIVSELSS